GASATATIASPAPVAPTIATSPIASSAPLHPSRQRALATLHAPCLGRRALVIVAQQVQDAVDQQPVELRRERLGALRRLPACGVQADHHVAQETHRCTARTLGLRERQDVGGTVLASPVAVQ